MSSSADFTSLRPALQRVLGGFHRLSNSPDFSFQHRLDRNRFPVPELLLILLRDVMGFDWDGPGEKVLWSVYFVVDKHSFAVEHAKFGLRVRSSAGEGAMLCRVLGQLESALGRLERRLQPLIAQQIADGNVILANRSAQFRARYLFFRDQADTAFRTSKPPRQAHGSEPRPHVEEVQVLVGEFSYRIRAERQGFFYSVAATDAYFSYLEHQLTLLRAFLGAPLPDTGVVGFLRSRWDEKLKDVLATSSTTHAALIGRLRDLKERIRNPFAHGGVENDGGSIFCILPGVGPIPGNMSRTRNGAHFKWIPVDTEDHQASCLLFDELDEVLAKGRLSKASLMAGGGVDPAWNEDAFKNYRKLMRSSRSNVRHYIEHWNDEQDRHDNMDY